MARTRTTNKTALTPWRIASFALGVLAVQLVVSHGNRVAESETLIVEGLKDEDLRGVIPTSNSTANPTGFQKDPDEGTSKTSSQLHYPRDPAISVSEPGTFYGRMLQAVSTFFSDPEGEADDDTGFLSKRRKSFLQPARQPQVESLDLQDPEASSDLLATYQGIHRLDLPSNAGIDPPPSAPEEQEPVPAEDVSPPTSPPHPSLDNGLSQTKSPRPGLIDWGKSAWDSIASYLSPATGRAGAVTSASNEETTNYLRQQSRFSAPLSDATNQDGPLPDDRRLPAAASEWEAKARSVIDLLSQATDVFSPSSRAAVPGLSTALPPSGQQPMSLPGAAKTVVDAVSRAADLSDYVGRGPTRSSQRLTSSGSTHSGKPHISLDTLRHTDGIGKTFAQGVDVGGAVVDVLTSTQELQQALRDLDVVGLALPGRSQQHGAQTRGLNMGPLMSAATAIQRFANWSTAVDRAIDTGRDFTQTVSDAVRALRTQPQLEGHATSNSYVEELGRGSGSSAPMGHRAEQSPTESLADARHAQLKAEAVPEDQGLTSQASRTTVHESSHHESRPASGDSLALASRSRPDSETSVQDSAIARQLLQGPSATGRPLRILEKSAAVMEDVAGALERTSSPTRSSAGGSGEYVVSLARDLYKLASFLFEIMDVTVSVADESMDAVQLHKLVDSYQSLAEDGSLAAIGVKPGKVPWKDLGMPTVSCLKKGMTCCIPAAAVSDWKTRPVFLQNEKRRECKANFVTRTSMLCATTPFENSKCGIIHTSTADFNKYATVLPVAGFSSTALCECEMPRKRTAEGLSPVKGSASWTAAGKAVTRDLLKEAKEGWHLIKGISKTGNQVLDIVDHTLNPHRSAITGMADVMTKLVVNQQLQKIAETADPRSAVFPSISVELLPKVPLLHSLPSLPALPGLPVFTPLSRTLSGDVRNDAKH
ncbi:hypothetical protein CSUI_004935 [Cystoisospora suis]|uniref:Uncharacterized protein n=1 Tax=Cystoisospora suis TaxID=483139 RepID=A0A2C6KVH7_9APIC|nr:hypothetical protein CSUI_004935 [Cystoisospora suis]